MLEAFKRIGKIISNYLYLEELINFVHKIYNSDAVFEESLKDQIILFIQNILDSLKSNHVRMIYQENDTAHFKLARTINALLIEKRLLLQNDRLPHETKCNLAIANPKIEYEEITVTQLIDLNTIIDNINWSLASPHLPIINIKKIVCVNLDSCGLTRLPKGVFYRLASYSALSWLFLSNNHLTTIPSIIGNFKTITWLYLSHNQLTGLPKTIGNLTQLIVLDINDNNIVLLPESMGDLKSLIELNLKNNYLTTLPENFHKLQSLRKLLLDGNTFINFPQSILPILKNTQNSEYITAIQLPTPTVLVDYNRQVAEEGSFSPSEASRTIDPTTPSLGFR